MGTTDRVVYGSDDDLEDDISHEYRESLPTSRSTSASAAVTVQEDTLDANGERVVEAMQEAHARMFHETPSINITDQTGYFDLDSVSASTSLKRNQTTMEQLGSKQTTYSSKASRVRRFEAEDDELEMPAPKKARRSKSTQLSSEQSPRRVSESKRSGSTNFDMPSSHETHAAGSKEAQFASPFHTQTTVPFGATQSAIVPPQRISPMVLIPPMVSSATGHEIPEEPMSPHPNSSAVLQEQIDGLGDWLTNDIAQGQAKQEQAQRDAALKSTSLLDTNTMPLRPPEFKNHAKEDSQGSINPQELMLNQPFESPVSSVKSSQDPLANQDREQEVSQESTKVSGKRSTNDRRSRSDHDPDMKKPKAQSSQADNDGLEDLEAGLPPPEMYKPRPSKSRGRRATADPRSPIKPAPEPKNPRKAKRRKTVGDASTPIKIVDDDDEQPRPTKKAKTTRFHQESVQEQSQPHGQNPVTQPEQQDECVMAVTVAEESGTQDANAHDVEDRHPQRPGTVESGDIITEAEAEAEAEAATAAAVTKKRGRPKKQDKEKGKQLAEELQKKSDHLIQAKSELQALNVSEANSEDVVAMESGVDHPQEDEPVSVPKRRQAKKTARLPASDDESEDELAGNPQPEKTASKAVPEVAETAAALVEESAETVKPPAKRGRKPKAKAKSVATIHEDPDETARAQVLTQEEEEETAPEPPRSPLKEKANVQNQNLQVVAPGREKPVETPSRSASPEKASAPETPRTEQKGGIASKPAPLTAGKVKYRVGLSRRMRIEPLLKTLKR